MHQSNQEATKDHNKTEKKGARERERERLTGEQKDARREKHEGNRILGFASGKAKNLCYLGTSGREKPL